MNNEIDQLEHTEMLAVAEYLRRLSPKLDIIECERILQSADLIELWANTVCDIKNLNT